MATDDQQARKKVPKQLSFEEAMQRTVRRTTTVEARCIAGYMPLLSALAGVGVRMMAGSPLGMGVAAGLVGVGALGLGLRRYARGARRETIDWNTAEPYETALRTEISPQALGVLHEAARDVMRLGYRAHLFRMDCLCEKDGAECLCRHRVVAGILPVARRRAVVIVGDRLLASGPEVLRFVMRHERTHLAPLLWWMSRARTISATAGAFLIGVLVTGATLWGAVGALLIAHLASGWAIELLCDARAARHEGDGAAAWAMYLREKSRTRGFVAGWWRRGISWAAWIVPTHPPVKLRAWICRVVDRRAQRRSMRVS